jgi:hypothetical protein
MRKIERKRKIVREKPGLRLAPKGKRGCWRFSFLGVKPPGA